jgi:hypothetical protein
MTENEFRRIALAQGCLPATPQPAPDQAVEPDARPDRPADNPAMVNQRVPTA